MRTLFAILSLSTTGLALPALAQHDHHAAGQVAEAPGPSMGRPSGRPAREWTKQPLLIGKGQRGERSSAAMTVRGLTVSSVTVYASEGPPERRKTEFPVGPEGTRINSVAPKTGNYHWVVAREESPEAVKVASTAWYFGEPGDSPKDMLTVPKHELEIVPAPLPREHRSYREAEKWDFLVRLNGQPLPGQPLTLETEFGSRSTATTDERGYATIVFPRDFKPKSGAEENDPRSRGRFVLSTEKEESGRRYLTAFNYTYTQDPDRNRSIGWGAAFGILGMMAATPLLRRRKQQGGNDNHA